LDWDACVIEEHPEIDIATFRFKQSDVNTLGKSVLTGYQKQWPPAPPAERSYRGLSRKCASSMVKPVRLLPRI
jgi:hypothetical protein